MLIWAEVKMKRDFTCSSCGKMEEGTVVMFNVKGDHPFEISEVLNNIANEKGGTDFPVGWSGVYQFKFLCEKCK